MERKPTKKIVIFEVTTGATAAQLKKGLSIRLDRGFGALEALDVTQVRVVDAPEQLMPTKDR